MPTHESYNRALRQRDALAVEVERLRHPEAGLDLPALVNENASLRAEVRRLTEELQAARSDNARALRNPPAEGGRE